MLGHVRRRAGGYTGAGDTPDPTGDDTPTAKIALPRIATARSWRATPRRWLLPFAIGALLPLLVVCAAVLFTLDWDGVYPGVRAGGTDLGGLSRDEASARLAADAARWDATTLTLTTPAASHPLTRADLGLRYDTDATLAAVYGQGRADGALDRLSAILGAFRHGRDVAPRYAIDESALRARMQGLAGATDVQPRDGALRVADGKIVVTPPIEGRGLDVDAATALLIANVATGGATPLALPVAERIQPRINAAVLDEARANAERLLATPIGVLGPDLALNYDAATIGSWLVIAHDPAADPPLSIAIDAARVRDTVAPLAPRVKREPQNATYAFDPATGTFAVTTLQITGRTLDTDATVAAFVAALEGDGAREVRLAMTSQPAALTSGDIAAIGKQAKGTYLAGPLTFTHAERRWTLTPEQLAGWLAIEPGTGGARLAFDADALDVYVIGIKREIDRPAIDATYAMDDGSDAYRLTGPSRTGFNLAGPAAYRAAIQTLRAEGGNRALALPVAEIRPKVTEADVAALQPERWVEVDLTAQRMYAVVGKKRVHTAVISSGKKNWETPTGTFHIIYRVENETMTSESIGAEENYRLENVLYTQYFTNEGHALHYSWWKTPESFGTPSSHGCLSETLKDAEYFWKFAAVGTRVTIHGKTPLK